MSRAMHLARSHHTHPNPRVGAVIVDVDGKVIGEGAHAGPGSDHAEAVALAMAGKAARGSTLYVTLEPCSHHGLTPPCVEAIIAAGVGTTVVGVVDPDARVAGTGISRLREAGIDVVMAADPDEAISVDPGYFHHRRTGLPTVTLKFAMTLDGAVSARDGTSRWITGEAARADAHRLRATMDAVVIGSGTLKADDPLLDVREGTTSHQPKPVVLAGRSDLPASARLWEREPLVLSTTPRVIPSGQVIVVDGRDGRPHPESAALALAELGLYDLLLEGGPTVAGEWWRAGLIGRGVVYLGGKMGGGAGVGPIDGVFGSMSAASDVTIGSVVQIGNDLRIEFT